MSAAVAIVCPECAAPMVLRETPRFTYPNGQPRKFYGCSTWPACRSTHGAHPNGKPMGVPADPETKRARTEAHAALDGAADRLGMTKKERYGWLQVLTGRTEDEAHIAKFTKDECEQLIGLLG